MDFGKRLKDIRVSKNISVYRLAKETGLSNSYIRDLERGIRNPSLYTLRRLSEAIGISASEMLKEDEVMSYITEDEQKLLEDIRLLSDDKKEALLHMLAVLKRDR